MEDGGRGMMGGRRKEVAKEGRKERRGETTKERSIQVMLHVHYVGYEGMAGMKGREQRGNE